MYNINNIFLKNNLYSIHLIPYDFINIDFIPKDLNLNSYFYDFVFPLRKNINETMEKSPVLNKNSELSVDINLKMNFFNKFSSYINKSELKDFFMVSDINLIFDHQKFSTDSSFNNNSDFFVSLERTTNSICLRC